MKLRRAALRIAPSALAVLILNGSAPPSEAGEGRTAGRPAARPDEIVVVVERTELKWSKSGRLLGHLVQGASVERLGGAAEWTRVRVRGWMWRPSLEETRGGYRVAPARENLRRGPNGFILGTLARGTEVRRVGARGRWYEIELIGWVPDVAVEAPESDEPGPEETPGDDEAEALADSIASAEAEEVDVDEPTAAEAALPVRNTGPSETAAGATTGRLVEPVPLRSVPEGGTVLTLPAGLVLQPVETRGPWTRVVVEGWVRTASIRTGEDEAGPAAVALSPEAFEGRRVTWTVEHVALQRADRWRTDFEPGEHYDLARVPGGEGRYVYLVVPESLLDAFQRLSPFEKIRVEGRIRTGRSDLTGNPILVVTRLLP